MKLPPPSDHPTPPDADQTMRRARNRRQLLLIVALTLLPLVVAWVLFHTASLNEHLGQSNHGNLITPPKQLPTFTLFDLDGKPLPDKAFTHHWSLIYIGGVQCNAQCVKRAFEVHNIRWLLQSHYKQLRVFYLAPDATAMTRAQQALLSNHVLLKKAGDIPVMVTDPPVESGAKPTAEAGAVPTATAFFGQPPGSLVLVDPLGRWTMSYPPGFSVDGVYKDFRHLLRFSQLG